MNEERLPEQRVLGSKFEDFIHSLPIVDQETESAIEKVRMERFLLSRYRGESDQEIKDRQKQESTVHQALHNVENLIGQKGLSSSDKQQIMRGLDRSSIPFCLLQPELEDVNAWLRFGNLATLAAASFFYNILYVQVPRASSIRRSLVDSLIDAWVSRGEISQREAPVADWLIRHLIEGKIIRRSRQDKYSNDLDEEFEEGLFLKSVGRQPIFSKLMIRIGRTITIH